MEAAASSGFAQRIQQLRVRYGFTQIPLAAALGGLGCLRHSLGARTLASDADGAGVCARLRGPRRLERSAHDRRRG
jgi:hypothetical protein